MEIFELRESRNPIGIPVRVRHGTTPEQLDGASRYGARCQVGADEFLLQIPGTANFYAHGGREVIVSASPDAVAADVSTYLLGSVFGALCHQNALLPLHASAVTGARGVTAFLGDSGAGKSTLAAFLERRGYAIVSDDICLVEPGKEGPRVVPVAGWLKLWRQSFDRLGQTPDERNRTFSADDKYRVYLKSGDVAVDGGESARLPLAHAIFLERSAAAGIPRLEPISTAAAIAGLMDMIYLGYITELTGTQARAFQQCAEIMAGARAWRLIGPWGWDAMEATLDLIEDLLGPSL